MILLEMIYLSIVCPDCGEENGEGAKFCKKCGAALEVQSSSIFESEPKSKRNIIIIAIAAILCIAAIAGAMLYLNGDFLNEKELNDGQRAAADTTGDGELDIADLSHLKQYVSKKISWIGRK